MGTILSQAYVVVFVQKDVSNILVNGQKHLVKSEENFAAQLFCAAWSCERYYNSD